ncbi:MAG: hypothetical protein V1898_02045 [Patescibacteria group bacterium]
MSLLKSLAQNFASLVKAPAMKEGIKMVTKISADPRAVNVINNFLLALTISNEAERIAAIIPLVHKSLLISNGQVTDLAREIKDFMYKKAVQNVKFYEYPSNVSQVQQGQAITIGFKETAETGRQDKYFINKKTGVAGLPAPIIIFWPADGSGPKIVNFGSL